MERALSIPSWPASNGPVYSTKTRMPPRRGRSPAKFSTTGTPSPPSSPIPICRPPTTMPRQHSGMRSSQGGSASEREPRKGRALMRPSSASLKPAGGERSMRGVSSQKPSGMPGEANRQRPSRHLPNPGKVNGYGADWVAIDPARGDLAAPAPFDRIVDPDHHWPGGHEPIRDHRQQRAGDGATVPPRPAEHKVVEREIAGLAEAHDAQGGDHRALAGRQHYPGDEHQHVLPNRGRKEASEGCHQRDDDRRQDQRRGG